MPWHIGMAISRYRTVAEGHLAAEVDPWPPVSCCAKEEMATIEGIHSIGTGDLV
jgi:hypothetical protein